MEVKRKEKMSKSNLKSIEAIFIICIMEITHILLDFPNKIINECSSSAVLNIIYISILTLIFFLVVYELLKPFKNGNILDVAQYVGGDFLKLLVSLTYIFYMVIVAAFAIRNFSSKLKLIYFPNASSWSIIGIFILASLLSSNISKNNIVKVNAMLIPLIFSVLILIFILSIKNIMPERIYPILGNGFCSTFLNGSLNIYVMSGMRIFAFHKIKFRKCK